MPVNAIVFKVLFTLANSSVFAFPGLIGCVSAINIYPSVLKVPSERLDCCLGSSKYTRITTEPSSSTTSLIRFKP